MILSTMPRGLARSRRAQGALALAALTFAAGLTVGRMEARADADCRYQIVITAGQAESVFDQLTGLTWERAPKTATPLNLASAQDYCEALAPQDNRWRVPSVQELQSILDDRLAPPFYDAKFLEQGPTDQESFWTSTPVSSLETSAWVVDFETGKITNDDMGAQRKVRCVR